MTTPRSESFSKSRALQTRMTTPVSQNLTLVDRVIAQMADSWARGRPCMAEELFRQYPELKDQTESAVRVLYEEFCLRQEHKLPADPKIILERFPEYRSHLEVLLECDRALAPALAESPLPRAGESWHDFQLIKELGRGAQGAVFLAVQPSLDDRPVVLKITPCDGREHLSLARLQHTNIVPLYAAHDDAPRNMRTLCMPYFGGASLAQALKHIRDIPMARRTGQTWLAAIDQLQAGQPVIGSLRGPRQVWAQASYVQVLCLMGAGLAEGLQYAHERGLVHLDIKPANVLVAADGQPMLLDFHLAQEPIKAYLPPPPWMGGTPLYMSPEQSAVLNAIKERRIAPEAVDGRSDIYSLGLLLHEALGGPLPVDSFLPSVLPKCNPHVTTGLADIIHKCLAREPRDRYQSAAALAEDLRRHVSDQPLKGVSNRSLPERWAKWRRRRPWALYGTLAMALAAISISLAGGLIWTSNRNRQIEARSGIEAALAESQSQIERGHFDDAVATLGRARATAEALPAADLLRIQVRREFAKSQSLRASDDLHLLADRIRFLYAAEKRSSSEAQTLAASCLRFWSEHDRLQELLEDKLNDADRSRLRADVLDLAVMGADLAAASATPGQEAVSGQEALRLLEEAERVFEASPALLKVRARLAQRLGLTALAEKAEAQFKRLQPSSAWEHIAVGRIWLQAGPDQDLNQAASSFREAARRQPGNFWAHYYGGVCSFRLQRFEEADRSFAICASLQPDSLECRRNRELAEKELAQVKERLRAKLAGNADGLELLKKLEGL